MLDEEDPLQGLRDRVLALRSLPTLAGVDDAGLTLIAEHSRIRRFRAGEHVLRPGERLRHVYMVLDGRLIATRNGKRTPVVRPRGVGVMTLLAGDQLEIEVQAEIDTLTMTLPLSGLEEAIEENFSLTRSILRGAANTVLAIRGNLPVAPANAKDAVAGEYPERPITLVERILMLRSEGFFSRCNVDALVAIARATREVRLPAGEVVWRVGDPATFWLRIDHGRVRCTTKDGSSVEVGRGFTLGLMESLGQQQRAYEARAETALVASRLELSLFLPVMEAHVQLARTMLASFAQAQLDAMDSERPG